MPHGRTKPARVRAQTAATDPRTSAPLPARSEEEHPQPTARETEFDVTPNAHLSRRPPRSSPSFSPCRHVHLKCVVLRLSPSHAHLTTSGALPDKILVTGGTGLVGSALQFVIENEPVGSRYGRLEGEEWIFLGSKDGDLK